MISSYLSYLTYDSTQSLEFYFLKVIYKLEIYLLFMMMEQNVSSLSIKWQKREGHQEEQIGNYIEYIERMHERCQQDEDSLSSKLEF